MDAKKTFEDLQARFLRIEADNPEDGHLYVSRLAKQAGKAVRQCCQEGSLILEWVEFTSKDSGPPQLLWQAVCVGLANVTPAGLPAHAGIIRMKRLAAPAGGVRVGWTDHRDWRERAADYAAVCGVLAEMTADSKTDSNKKIPALVPENPAVAKLALDIKKRKPKGDSMIDVARDFAKGDEKLAQSVLRQLRRFPHLLD